VVLPVAGSVLQGGELQVDGRGRLWIVPIPGSTRLDRKEEYLGSVSIKLDTEELNGHDEAIARITVLGDRDPPYLAQTTGR